MASNPFKIIMEYWKWTARPHANVEDGKQEIYLEWLYDMLSIQSLSWFDWRAA